MIVDGHAHACGEYLTQAEVMKKLQNANVDMVVLTPGEYGSKITYPLSNVAKKRPLDDVVSKNNQKTQKLIKLMGQVKNIPKGNQYVYELKKGMPDKIKQFYWVIKENYQRVEEDYQKMDFDGIKFHQCWESFDIEEDFFQQTVLWATEKQLPIFIHLSDLEQVSKLIKFIKKNPEAVIIVAHLYGVELFAGEDVSYFKNTYFDLSNCNFVSKERTMLAYRYFGSDKLLMGSDTPYGKKALEQTIEQIEKLPIPRKDIDKILGENFRQLLKEHSADRK